MIMKSGILMKVAPLVIIVAQKYAEHSTAGNLMVK